VPFRVLTSSGLLWNAKVLDIIEGDTWAFPSGNLELQPIWDSITFNPRSVLLDHYVWNGHHRGGFLLTRLGRFLEIPNS
jgi:hypothetical protein